jgi:hypothetical protein
MEVKSQQKKKKHHPNLGKLLQQRNVFDQTQCGGAEGYTKKDVGDDQGLAGIQCGGSQGSCTGENQKHGKDDGLIQAGTVLAISAAGRAARKAVFVDPLRLQLLGRAQASAAVVYLVAHSDRSRAPHEGSAPTAGASGEA